LTEPAWSAIDGIDPSAAAYPVSVRYNGEPIWVFRTDAGMFAVQDECPHTNQTLGTAQLVGTRGMLRCIYHNYTFRLSDGRGVNCPGFAIAVYDVKEEGGKLFVRPR
jgi:nitrite reductase/ring-hydroxylating ferredoxin subunit